MEKELQQKYLELQMLDNNIRNVQKQIQIIDQQMLELIATRQSIEELGEVKLNSETLAPIANGIFIKANITNNDELIVNVGSDVAVVKKREEVIKMIEKQLKGAEMTRANVLSNLQNFIAEAQKIEQELKNV